MGPLAACVLIGNKDSLRIRYTDWGLKGTVTASVAATGSAPEMVSRREYHPSVLIDVILFFTAGQTRIFEPFWNVAQYGCSIIPFVAKPLECFKTKSAEARQLETICGKRMEDVTGNDYSLAPARPLIKLTFGYPALVVTAAYGALFGQAQTFYLYRRNRILLLRFGLACRRYAFVRVRWW